MSLVRPTLRPVVWADVDAHGRPKRRERSDSSDDEVYTPDRYHAKKKSRPSALPAVYYPPPLSPSEKMWRDRTGFFYQEGYQLRPRYQPNWSPTCLGNGRHHHSGEDHIMQILPQVLDAIRRQDGLVVCIKMIQDVRKIHQIKITQYFSTRRMIGDSRNHVVPFYDTFADNFTRHIEFMVMPVLRQFNDPPFVTASEVVDFITQTLEGLVFLHENNVAHHNLTAEHIMMDAKSLVPTGWHFVSHFCEPDGMTQIRPLERRNNRVRYYFIGFGNAYHIPPDKQPLVLDIGGDDDDVPELYNNKMYDPFKLDIYTLGNVFLKYLYNEYKGLDFILDLLNYMHVRDFAQRPGAETVLLAWIRIRKSMDEDAMDEWRLKPREARQNMHHPEDTDSPRSGASRSDKRDISSILNKASFAAPGVYR